MKLKYSLSVNKFRYEVKTIYLLPNTNLEAHHIMNDWIRPYPRINFLHHLYSSVSNGFFFYYIKDVVTN